jgi:hypothetical protein
MNDTLRDLLLNGFMIYPGSGKFIVKKESVPSNPLKIEETIFDTYEAAIEAAEKMLNLVPMLHWVGIVRYNRGLGIEYKNLPEIQSSSKEEAQKIAENLAETILGDGTTVISEVKVRLKN